MDSPDTGIKERTGLRPLALAWLAFAGATALAAGGITFFGNANAGNPVARLSLAPAADETGDVPAPSQPQQQAQGGTPSAAPAAPVYAGRALVADPALIETTATGPLPKIAIDGRTPRLAYAGAPVPFGKPRIALVVGGLGMSARATQNAIDNLPPEVTLAFAPYAADVQRWVNAARARGHEVLIEVPMEPFDFPDSDPGPHTLRAGASESANTDKLVWSLTRVTGYTGATNLLGARFLSQSDALSPFMTYLARRGLLFFDNGTAPQSVAPDVARETGAAFAQSQNEIDSIQTAMEIDRRLSELETVARAGGVATGSGFLYPITVGRVAQWAQGLSARGFVLVPVSAIVKEQK